MAAMEVVRECVQVVTTLAVVFVIGWLGRLAARVLRQPEVIGEIVAGLAAGPAAVALLGPRLFSTVLPDSVLDVLKLFADIGLVLFLVGLTHRLHHSGQRLHGRTTGWTVAGGLVPALLAGVLLACWILFAEDGAVRGHASLPSFLLMCATATSITAVPVLARMLADCGLTDTVAGGLAMTAAVVIDTFGWLLLSISVGLNSGEMSGFFRVMAVLAGGALVAFLVRQAARTRAASVLCTRMPWSTSVLLGAAAIAMGLAAERLGLTAVFGAVLIGLAIPAERADAPWAKRVVPIGKAGKAFLPAFFVVTGITVFARGVSALHWPLIVVAIVLAVLGKGAGSYLGARLGGESRHTALRVGVLMNMRGLTELIVLKVGFSAGIISAPLFVALVIMAVAVTVLTGPLLRLLERRVPAPADATPE